MATFVSILSWRPQSGWSPDALRRIIHQRHRSLRRRGLHSVALLPGSDGECSAVIVASCEGEAALGSLTASLVPAAADVQVETLRFDEPLRAPRPAPPADYRVALLRALRA
jgi:hypothetical protein